MNVAELVNKLKAEQLNTWFDLGLFLDRLKVQSAVPSTRCDGDLEEFHRTISSGVGFVTFDYGIDGVTMEIVRYAKTLQRILGGIPIHFISGKFSPEIDGLLDPSWERSVLRGLDGFDSWPLYESFFHRRLDRGGPLYNELIGLFWTDVLSITERARALYRRPSNPTAFFGQHEFESRQCGARAGKCTALGIAGHSSYL